MATYVAKTSKQLYELVQEQCFAAMKDTVEECYKELERLIKEDVYKNKPKNPKFRSRWLLANYREIIKIRAYRHFGQDTGINIKPNLNMDVPSAPKKFLHGAVLDKKEEIYSSIKDMTSYLEMLNNPSFINNNNPFHFPTRIEAREPFWDDFVEWFEKNIESIYGEKLSHYVELRNLPFKGDRYVVKSL